MHPAADELVGEQAEPAPDLVDPAGSGRGEVDMEPGVTGQPGLDLGSLVGAVVVGDQVNVQLGRHGLVDGDQELLALGRAVTAVELADHGAVGDVARREQAGDAVAVVVMGAPLSHAGSTGWDRSSAWIWACSSTHSTTARSGGLW